MNPLVSVIVPNYNHAHFLERRLDSILNQTFQDFELIILDDCSTDNSKEVIERYRQNSKVSKIIYNEKNSGSPFKQWAKGFELAQGEYIWIAESDDWAELIFLETLVPKLIDEKIALAFCNSKIVYPDKTIIDIDQNNDTMYNGDELIRKKMIYANYILNASSVLFKKEFLLKIPTTYQTFKSSGDWLFWIEFCLLGNVYFCSQLLNYNNRHGENTTKMWGSKMSSGTAAIEDSKIFNYMCLKRKISFYQKHCLVNAHIRWTDQEKDKFTSNEVFLKVRNTWRSFIFSETISLVIEKGGFYLYRFLKVFHLWKD